ncbi:MFS transporter [Rhodococcoides yunnanense]|uniref:MFS transporter n=1 Tax=Rhodococcoides yunnanense TaxID=278209 RepID=UPI00353026E3
MTRPTSPHPAMTPRRAAIAALLGSALEYYDFFIYGAAAALVFNVLSFPTGDPTVALIASLATFAVGYVARPIGAVVMGHFGDRVGRKRVMLITVVMMGAASFAIGCLPTVVFLPVALLPEDVLYSWGWRESGRSPPAETSRPTPTSDAS